MLPRAACPAAALDGLRAAYGDFGNCLYIITSNGAGLDEGLLALPLPILVCMDSQYK